jgi:ribonuclease-3
MEKSLRLLCEAISYKFNDIDLLKEAMTHKSYAVEYNLKYDNQRLEFLGDAVLELITTERLFKQFPNEQEGRMTKMRSAMVCQQAFVKIALFLNLQDSIRVGRGELLGGGTTRNSTLCDAFEALAGAIYMDSDYKKANEVFLPLFDILFPNPDSMLEFTNPKGALQELTQSKSNTPIPKYVVENKEGPDHDCVYSVAVFLNEQKIAVGTGRSRKAAEFEAAKNALTFFRQEK